MENSPTCCGDGKETEYQCYTGQVSSHERQRILHIQHLSVLVNIQGIYRAKYQPDVDVALS
jgi:transposase-like protein